MTKIIVIVKVRPQFEQKLGRNWSNYRIKLVTTCICSSYGGVGDVEQYISESEHILFRIDHALLYFDDDTVN